VSDGTKDPGLTEEGLARANRLATMLESQTVTAIYSTPYQRTRLTVAPLAAKKNLTITEYDAGSKSSISEIVQKNAGGTVVIVGHSNTVPAMLNQLIGKEEFKNFDDTDYGNLVIVSVMEGSTNPKITWLRF
jgi:broad specificity phosphatase PhoE